MNVRCRVCLVWKGQEELEWGKCLTLKEVDVSKINDDDDDDKEDDDGVDDDLLPCLLNIFNIFDRYSFQACR